MLVDVPDLRDLVTILVRTGNREFMHKSPDGDIRLHLADDPRFAQGAVSGLDDAGLAE